MTSAPPPVVESLETGRLGIAHLKRVWSRSRRDGQAPPLVVDAAERQLDEIVFDALGLGRRQVHGYLGARGGDFDAFEQWILDTTGGVEPDVVARFNALVRGDPPPGSALKAFAAIDAAPDALSAEDLAHWEREGYVVLRNAVDEPTRAAVEQLIWDAIGGRSDDPDSWYGRSSARQGITLEIYQHAALRAARGSRRIHKAFAQLWGTADLWPTIDRPGFNPPIRPDHIGSVQGFHWDVSLARPIPFGTQGMLYLTDNPAEQGAFALVPGFHRRLDGWLDGLPPGTDPRREDLKALGAVPVPGRAGDLVIWSHLLPHGPTENHGQHPRMVLYLNYYASAYRAQEAWI